MTKRASNGNRWRKVRARVLDEEPNCAACGIWLDRSLPRDHPAAPQVDHIVPFHARPDLQYDRDNLQAMCRACNIAKSGGTRTPKPPAPIQTSRPW